MPKKKTFNKPPVVTIMGHVDHGKTTLLDKIRNSQIAASEQGGITQHTSAYQITYQGKPITFIDTPGHAAFSKMRSRGAKVTDIALLVVAADDGIKPQTKESIKHIKESGAPTIVAINKIDAKGASPEMVKAQLVKEGIQVEGYGGSTPAVEISSLKGTNIDKLLDTILILSEIENFQASPSAPLQAIVIESHLKKDQGPIATLLIKQGTLKLGDRLIAVSFAEPIVGTTKRLKSTSGQNLDQAIPSTPVEILGLKTLPPVGSILTHPCTKDKIAKLTNQSTSPQPKPETSISDQTKPDKHDQNKPKPKTTKKQASTQPKESDPAEEEEQKEEKPHIKVILKTDTAGTLEAITQNLTEEAELISSSIGEVTESDILLAQSTGAVIITFNTPISSSAKKLAEIESVSIKTYSVIYKLLEDLQNQILKLLEPTIDEQELGIAKVQAIFKIKDNLIAGCKVESGSISQNSAVHLKRNHKILGDATIISLKHQKEELSTAKAGTECGLILKPKLDIKVGDRILSYKKINQ